jgi:hypothetical protein
VLIIATAKIQILYLIYQKIYENILSFIVIFIKKFRMFRKNS